MPPPMMQPAKKPKIERPASGSKTTGPGDGFHQLLHRAPPQEGERLEPESGALAVEPVAGTRNKNLANNVMAVNRGGYGDYAIFCRRIKLRTVSLGCAPRPSQCFTRSESSLISAGFCSGSYVPTASTMRPSLARVLSITTTR